MDQYAIHSMDQNAIHSMGYEHYEPEGNPRYGTTVWDYGMGLRYGTTVWVTSSMDQKATDARLTFHTAHLSLNHNVRKVIITMTLFEDVD